MYSAYNLTAEFRRDLYKAFMPHYAKFIAHHVTYKFDDSVVPPPVDIIEAVGYALDDGVEVFVIAVDGSTYRPDGGIFHLTYSLDKSRRPVDSNTLLHGGWKEIMPFALQVIPAVNV